MRVETSGEDKKKKKKKEKEKRKNSIMLLQTNNTSPFKCSVHKHTHKDFSFCVARTKGQNCLYRVSSVHCVAAFEQNTIRRNIKCQLLRSSTIGFKVADCILAISPFRVSNIYYSVLWEKTQKKWPQWSLCRPASLRQQRQQHSSYKNKTIQKHQSELKSCVKVEVAVLGSRP